MTTIEIPLWAGYGIIALPGALVVGVVCAYRMGKSAGWAAHRTACKELARLRAIEAAAREWMNSSNPYRDQHHKTQILDALRATP